MILSVQARSGTLQPVLFHMSCRDSITHEFLHASNRNALIFLKIYLFFTQRQQKCTCRWLLWQEITYKCILPCMYPPFTSQSSIIIKSTKTFFATCEPSRVRPADAGALSQGAQGPVVMSQHNVVQPAIQEHLNLEKPVALLSPHFSHSWQITNQSDQDWKLKRISSFVGCTCSFNSMT